MSGSYRHLKELDRVLLGIMFEKGYPKSKIATILKVHRSTIYREIKRNSYVLWHTKERGYLSLIAQKKAASRRQRSCKLEKDKTLRDVVTMKLKKRWSPWQIEGWLKHHSGLSESISHESTYKFIYSDYAIRNKYFKKLRRKHFHRKKRHARQPRFPKHLLIDKRPREIALRESYGHWECDLMMFKRGIKGNLITLRERKSRYTIALKNENKTASKTAMRLTSCLKNLKNAIKSVTFDQGSEFKKYQWIKDCLECSIHFCDPGAPYQKGGIENVNGVIRTELPRSIDIAKYSQKDVNALVDEINERPMKCLGYRSPKEVFYEEFNLHENQFY